MTAQVYQMKNYRKPRIKIEEEIPTQCPKCEGRLAHGKDEDGELWVCLPCLIVIR